MSRMNCDGWTWMSVPASPSCSALRMNGVTRAWYRTSDASNERIWPAMSVIALSAASPSSPSAVLICSAIDVSPSRRSSSAISSASLRGAHVVRHVQPAGLLERLVGGVLEPDDLLIEVRRRLRATLVHRLEELLRRSGATRWRCRRPGRCSCAARPRAGCCCTPGPRGPAGAGSARRRARRPSAGRGRSVHRWIRRRPPGRGAGAVRGAPGCASCVEVRRPRRRRTKSWVSSGPAGFSRMTAPSEGTAAV